MQVAGATCRVRLTAAALATMVVALTSCSVHVSAMSSKESIPETAYTQDVRAGMANINTTATHLHPICDTGGQRQGCYEASTQTILAVAALERSLTSHAVPDRFTAANTALVRALKTDAEGLTLRNRAIATESNPDWVKGQALIADATDRINEALGEFPADAGLAP